MIESIEQFMRHVGSHPDARARGFLKAGAETIIARAPGRLDLMGGIADYSGSLVLQWPIREATWVALQVASSGDSDCVSILSLANAENNDEEGGEHGRTVSCDVPLAALKAEAGGDTPAEYASLRARLTSGGDPRRWAAYVLGAFLVLMRERGASFTRGMRLLIASDVPEGKGVSSSAALEVATMQAAAAASGTTLAARELGLLCQKVENLVVGAPCGVMDQMASACGADGALMALRCQPAELLGSVPMPEGLAVWGIDSGVRHSVSGADYATVRTAAFMGLRIIEQAGEIDLGGYLTRLSPSEFEQHYAAHLPETIPGSEFTRRYGAVADPLSIVIPDRVYRVRAAAEHPIYENFRVHAFQELLQGSPVGHARAALLGELTYQAHASYSACGLGSDATDRLVALVRDLGPGSGLFGAKITGGGSGGTVAVLGRPDAAPAVSAVAARYAEESGSGRRPYIFAGSSPGAAATGVQRVGWS